MASESISSPSLSPLDISVNEPMITDGLKWPKLTEEGVDRGGRWEGGERDALPAQDGRKRSHLSLTWLLVLFLLLSVEGYLTAPKEEVGGEGGEEEAERQRQRPREELNAHGVKVNEPRPSLLGGHQVDRFSGLLWGFASAADRWRWPLSQPQLSLCKQYRR